MSNTKQINSRLQQKHDIEANWNKAVNFIPLLGELILYDPDETCSCTRFKVGDGIKVAKDLPFVMIDAMQVIYGTDTLASLLNMYMLQIDYDLLAFDTEEIVFTDSNEPDWIFPVLPDPEPDEPGSSTITAKLGFAVLGSMILGHEE